MVPGTREKGDGYHLFPRILPCVVNPSTNAIRLDSSAPTFHSSEEYPSGEDVTIPTGFVRRWRKRGKLLQKKSDPRTWRTSERISEDPSLAREGKLSQFISSCGDCSMRKTLTEGKLWRGSAPRFRIHSSFVTSRFVTFKSKWILRRSLVVWLVPGEDRRNNNRRGK